MSPLPLRTPSLYPKLPPLSYTISGLLAVGCRLPRPPIPFPATRKNRIKRKSFLCNAYKKHGGVGEHFSRLVSRSPRATCGTHSNTCNSNPLMRLIHGSLDTRGGGVCPAPRPSSLPPAPPESRLEPLTSNFRLSTLSTSRQSWFNSHRTPVTEHKSRITPP